ncbi:hypothetical protein FIBSPDRAFT_886890 [Athelia psychrophila]|uniref:F-box domain-containing protein n=1 Tax=Athelia psychrophila TaxID=1759441 RepID=A0A166QCD0_9AGAM|nr:hypothetical protein FIBSPDRAFT_886890 [Fibularhizoctonia sp. CBS 109695]
MHASHECFAEVPTEIHRNILTFGDTQSLVPCTAVSKQWRSVALSMSRMWSDHCWRICPTESTPIEIPRFWLSLSIPHPLDLNIQLSDILTVEDDHDINRWSQMVTEQADRIFSVKLTGRMAQLISFATHFGAFPNLHDLSIHTLPRDRREDGAMVEARCFLHAANLRSLTVHLPLFDLEWRARRQLPFIIPLPWNAVAECCVTLPSVSAFLHVVSWAPALKKLAATFRCDLDNNHSNVGITSQPNICHLSISSVGDCPTVALQSLRLPGLIILSLDGHHWSITDSFMVVRSWQCNALRELELEVTSIPENIHQQLQYLPSTLSKLTISATELDEGNSRLISALSSDTNLLPNLAEISLHEGIAIGFRLAQRFVISRLERLKFLGLFEATPGFWPVNSDHWMRRMKREGVMICVIRYTVR